MKLLSYPHLLALSLLVGTLGLSGCGGALNLPDSVVGTQVQGPAVRGSVYGGHAPIVGAHVYLVQPGTTGYGSPATSILGTGTTTSPGGYTLTADVNDPHVPVGSEYVTTDDLGGFNLTGAYVCTVGQPVYIYAYGGNASETPVNSIATYSVSQIVVSDAIAGAGGTATYTFTVSPSETLAAGQSVTISGLTKHFTILNNTYTVASATSTTFTLTGVTDVWETTTSGTKTTYHTIADGTYDTGNFSKDGDVTTVVQVNSPLSALATLGVCPSSGNFSTGGTAIAFVNMNEVSTIATAYTFQPFTVASNNNAWDIGSSGTTQALAGIANAALTAAQLYDIQGSGQVSTTNDGEGDLANYQTQSSTGVPNAGNGVVPQATIDSLANILAACIDSTPEGVNGLSAQCTTLFNTATDNGETVASGDTAPTDTATAAINIARYPAGNNSGTVNTSYVADLFGIPSGTVPYAPDLATAPNDWTLAINYPGVPVGGYSAANPTLGTAESLAVDSGGQIWITARVGDVVRWSPLGVQNALYNGSYVYGYISVDGSNNAWVGNADSSTGIEEFGSDGVSSSTYGSGYNSAATVITNQTGDAYFVASTAATGNDYELFEYGPGGDTLNGPISISPSVITAKDDVAHGAIDGDGDLWLTTESSYQIARVTPTGAAVFTPIVTDKQPEFPSIDAAGNAWIAVQRDAAQIYKVSPTGSTTILTSAGAKVDGADTLATGAKLASTYGSAVDGNGNVWFANRCGDYGACGTTAGENSIVEINGANNLAISPAKNNYYPEAQYPATDTTFTPILDDPLNVAIDPSGNVWVTNYTGSSVTELVGAAAPVVTPLSVAAGNNELGQKP